MPTEIDTISLFHFPVPDHCVWCGHFSKLGELIFYVHVNLSVDRVLSVLLTGMMAVLQEVTNSLPLFICILI